MLNIFSGQSKCKSKKMEMILRNLQWRQNFQNKDHYVYNLNNTNEIYIHQTLNGEMNGIGTGAHVWPAAVVLSKYLEKKYSINEKDNKHSLQGLRICDIGSGTGITGFVASFLGALEVTLTDQIFILPLLEINKDKYLQANDYRNNIVIKEFNWGESVAHLSPPFDIILVSDCILPKLYPIEPLIQVGTSTSILVIL